MKPNFLWIVSEDCPPRFGCYGDVLARTPNLDALAERSVLYEHAYAAAPVCAPSRFALLTGVPPEAHAPAIHMRAQAVLPDWMTTYPQELRALGYHLTNNAKTDYNADVDPAALWDDCSTEAHWRGRPADTPFLAVFNIDGTHESAVFRRTQPLLDPASIQLPAYLPDTPEIRADFARYYEDIERMDARVGELLAQLAEDGLEETTYVLHTSDHGGVNPRSKRHCYEEGLHVPLLLHAPSRFADRLPLRGTRVVSAVSTASIPATLIDLAGGTVPDHMVEPSLATPQPPTDALAFSARNRMDERYDFVRTVSDGRHRYIRNFLPHRPSGQYNGFAWIAAGYRSWEREHLAGRLTTDQDRFWQERPAVEFFDVIADPDQLVNLAGRPEAATVERRLAAALRDHMLAINDNGFLPEGSPLEGWDASRRPGAYDLPGLLDLAGMAGQRDPAHAEAFVRRLEDADPLHRRWAALGLLMIADRLGDAGGVVAGLLGAALDREGDATVRVAIAEALARIDPGGAVGVGELVVLADPSQSFGVRLEALNALTALEPDRLRDLSVPAAGDDDGEYLAQALEHLTLLVEGRYAPDVPVGSWARFF
ncbi:MULTISPECIES: sulfatase-like hydrolase/transferase [unclassified Nocardioides]|uniref:sulfatase-like hydrolase/transferase n=1 Tax=unclassified Nocardioides TaxID=2615069 RepID=UPI0006F925CC|nr:MULTISPECIES: sulfatase-like hydrolase/transferase [unclassified Nocardioides]KRA38634.1 hypothetical protein ASD81_08495 [Nocardioides sp. Root614]KRA92594.1 hypothetical protein ASD84_08760 [Nocardioides sp. Root682]